MKRARRLACPLWLDEFNVNHQLTFDSSLEIFRRRAKMTRHSLPEQVASVRLLVALPSYFPGRISYMIRLRSLLFVLIIALSLTAVTIVFADNPPPSTNGQPEPKTVGGQVAALGDWPWQFLQSRGLASALSAGVFWRVIRGRNRRLNATKTTNIHSRRRCVIIPSNY